MAFDYKKEYKDLYMPTAKPMIINVPEMTFIMVDGEGDPNTSPAYKNAMDLLYGLSYSIKMSKMSGNTPQGYFDYVVPPLEGLWWSRDSALFEGNRVADKSRFCWTSMIRQPEFVTEEVFESAKATLHAKRPELDLSLARLVLFTEGLCAQILHTGVFDAEPETVTRLETFTAESGYRTDISDTRRHHEIYLGDPRRIAPEKRRTVIRHPIAK